MPPSRPRCCSNWRGSTLIRDIAVGALVFHGPTALPSILGGVGEGLGDLGEGPNDPKMRGVAGLGIAIHAKPLVRAQAAATLNHHDLEGVLCLLGALACRDRRWC